jgi:hypothetical protein
METAKLVAGISSIQPGQKFTDETAAFWHTVLADVPYRDATTAIARIAQRQPFIGVNDICTEVTAIRKARLQTFDEADGVVPNIDPDDPEAFVAERRAIMAAVADGVFDRDRYELGGLTLTGVTAHVPRNLIPIEARPQQVQRQIVSHVRLPRVPRPATDERAESKAALLAYVSPAESADAEAERNRQLRALEDLGDDVS